MKAATILRDSASLAREFERTERLDPEELESLQSRRAIDQARFAMSNSPFYRERYAAAGFSLDDLRDPAAFTSLPIVEKSDIRENLERIKTPEATSRNVHISTTGGSTGEPLRLMHDLRFPARVLEWRLFRWWGVHPSDDLAIVYRQVRSEKETARYQAKWWPSKRFQLDAYRMDGDHIEQFITQWRATPPAVMLGYVGGIVELARYIEKHNLRIPSPKVIATTAAPLNFTQRAEIEAAFHAPVYDHYRCADVPWLAGECTERDGLHVFADVRKLEVVDELDRPVAPGMPGEVIVTDLTNRVFPLVRYRLGDRTSPISGSCRCGMTLPRIESVSGRLTEAAYLPSGRVVAGEALAQVFSKVPEAVRQFQIHQLSDYSLTVLCIPGAAFDATGTIGRVLEQLREIANHEVPVHLRIVDDIPHDGGKIRYIRSDISRLPEMTEAPSAT